MNQCMMCGGYKKVKMSSDGKSIVRITHQKEVDDGDIIDCPICGDGSEPEGPVMNREARRAMMKRIK
jgi:hypothetical protein